MNNGISFGIGDGRFLNPVFLSLVVILAVLLFIGGLKERGWQFVLAGGIANTASRLAFGGVYDYLHWQFGFDLWFNLADLLIVFGVIMVIGEGFVYEKKRN